MNTTGSLDSFADIGLRVARYLPARGTLPAYLIALALVGVALLVRMVFASIDAGYQYITFFPAVTLAVVIGGFGPGLFATILGAACAQYFFTHPYYGFSVESLETSFWTSVVFLVDGIIVSLSIESMHRYRSKSSEELKALQLQNNHIRQLQQQSEMLLLRNQSLMKNSMDGIHILDMQGNIVMANDAFCRMTGYTQEEVLRFNLADWEVQLSIDELLLRLKECIGNSVLVETLYCRKNGDLIDVEISVTGVLIGEQGYVFSSCRDITERKKSELALQESEARLTAVMKTLPVGVWITDGDGQIVFGNECGQKIWAGSRYVGIEQFGVYKGWWADSGKLIEPHEWAAARAIQMGEVSLNEEIEIECFDGTHKIILNSAMPYRGRDGGIGGVIIVNQDITGRRAAEVEQLRESDARFRGTLEQVAVGIIHAGLDGRFRQVNQKFCDIVGYSRDELLQVCFQDITFIDDLRDTMHCIGQLHAGESSTFSIEKRYVRKDGSLVWANMTVSMLCKADGAPAYFIGVAEDITERKHSERQLRDLSAHLQTVREDEKASVAREIHDNLGGTLTALKMDIYWLADELSASQAATPLLEHVNSMSKLLDNAVDVTRRVITDLRPTILDDLGLLAAIEWQAGQFQKRSGIKCRVACIDDFEVELDKMQSINLFRILQESLTNVARHSGATNVEVDLHHADEKIILSIVDDGCGLPEGHTVARTSFGMLGMRERVEQVNGEIYFSGSTGGGFSVTVMLPLHKDK